MQKKTLATIIILTVVAIITLSGVFAWQYYVGKSEARNSNSETAGWKTYKNDKYGFKIKYPNSFEGSVSTDSKKAGVLFYGENPKKLKLTGYFVNKFDSKYLGSSVNGGIFEKSEILINGIKSYKTNSVICYMGCGSSYSVLIPYKNGAIIIGISRGDGSEKNPNLVKITDAEKKNFDETISTFKFTNPTQASDAPIIESISPVSGPKRTTVEIRGENLSGFEGDLDVYFERADGKKIMLTDTFGDYAKTQDKLMKVKVQEPCRPGEKVIGRYSGVETECNYVELTPGTYKVYAEPWGKKTNIVNFQITGDSYSVDLNNDGKLDLLKLPTNLENCGSGGCILFVYKNTGTDLILINEISLVHEVYLPNTYTNGWRDIIIGVGGGGYIGTGFTKLQFNGKSYPQNPTTEGTEIQDPKLNPVL